MRYSIIYIILLSGLLVACQKESRIPIPYEGDKIVLNSFIQPDSLVYIRVTRSKPVKEYGNLQFPALENAEVEIFEDGTRLPVYWKVINGRGYYVTDIAAKEGKRYTLNVADSGLTSVSAEDSTPRKPAIKNGSAQKNTNRVRFTLTDDVAKTNYYRIRMYHADMVGGVMVPNKKDTVKFRLDPSFNNSFIDIIGDSYYSEVMVNDERVNGKEVLFVLQTSKRISSDYMMVEVNSLNEGGYKYLQATYEQRLGGTIDLSLDASGIFSNVGNGYGIVAGINASWLAFTVQ